MCLLCVAANQVIVIGHVDFALFAGVHLPYYDNMPQGSHVMQGRDSFSNGVAINHIKRTTSIDNHTHL